VSETPKADRAGGAPLLPPADPAADPEAAELLQHIQERTGRLLMLHRMLAHAPGLMRASTQTVMAMRYEVSVPRSIVELAILRTAQLAGSDYEWQQHVPMALDNGISQEKIDALPAWRTSRAYADNERAVLAFCDSMMAGEKADEAEFASLRQHYRPRQIVELALIIGEYLGTARFLTVLGVRPEADRI